MTGVDMTGRWHVPPDQLAAYLRDLIDQPTAASVEAHLVRCEVCRNAVAAQSVATGLRESWASIESAIDSGLDSSVQRTFCRLGVTERTMRTLAPTFSLQVAWLAATFFALLGAAVIARRAGGPEDGLARLVFLTIAPLAPLAAVVAALSSVSEPAPEIAQAAPVSRLRIGAVRATTVMGVAILMGMIASAVLPGSWNDAVVWLLPAVALSGLGALIAGRVEPPTAIACLGAVWVLTVTVCARLADDRFAAFGPTAQVLYFAVALAALAVIALRPDLLDLRRQP